MTKAKPLAETRDVENRNIENASSVGDDSGNETEMARWKRRLLLAGAVAFLFKLGLAWFSPGTQDVETWEQFVKDGSALGGLAVYHKPYTPSSFFNHPPFMLHFVGFLDWLHDVTGWPLRFCLRLMPSFADIGSAFVIWNIVNSRAKTSKVVQAFSPAAFFVFLFAPVSVWVSGFHGNTDPIMMMFVLLAIWWATQNRAPWLVGIAFGMSLNIKVVPLIFVPAFLMFLPGARARIEYSMAAAAMFFCGGLPYLLQEPLYILQRVFGYGGLYGVWGISRLLRAFPESTALEIWFGAYGRFVLIGALIFCSFWMNRLRQKPDLWRQCALLTLLFLVLTPGFGAQYLAWLAPLVVALELPAVAAFVATSGCFLSLYYGLLWSRYPIGLWPPPPLSQALIALGTVCWFVLVLIFALETRRLIREERLAVSS